MGQSTGLEGYYTIKNNKKMRFGYTTGSCAAAAAKGAVEMLLENRQAGQPPHGLPGLSVAFPCMVKNETGGDTGTW